MILGGIEKMVTKSDSVDEYWRSVFINNMTARKRFEGGVDPF
jgi:hypothetical protein